MQDQRPQIRGDVAQKLRDEAQALFEDAKAGVMHRVPDWLENAAFYKGDQWGHTSALGYHPDPDDPEEELQTINMVEAIVRTSVAELLQYIPNPEACAGADDPEQVARAEYAHRLLRTWVHTGVVDFHELERVLIGAKTFGLSFMCVYFDPRKGKAKTDYIWQFNEQDGSWSAVFDELGAHRVRKNYAGELAIRATDPFHLFVAPTATRWSEAWYVVERVEISTAEAREQFPKDYLGNPAQFGESAAQLDEFQLRTIDEGPTGMFAPGMRSQSNRVVEILRLYRRPCDEFPQGLFLCWSGSTILAIGPLGTWCWIPFYGDARGFGLWPKGLVQGLKSQQRLYNKHFTTLAEYMDAFAPGLLVPRGAKIDVDKTSNIPGWTAEYNAGFAPHTYEPPQLPTNIMAFGDTMLARMKDTSTVSDISRGVMPEGAESGTALSYLHEAQRGVHGPEVHLFRLSLVDVFRVLLKLAESHYRDGREMLILGQDAAWVAEPFHREGVDFDADLVIEPMGGAPQSKALREDGILRAKQFEIITGEEARRALEYDVLDRNQYNPDAAEKSEARRENYMWRKNPYGAVLEAVPAENHVVHMAEHNIERRSPLYKKLDAQARFVIDMHYQAHLQMHTGQIQGYAAQEQLGAPQPQPAAEPDMELQFEQPTGMGDPSEPMSVSQPQSQPIPQSAPFGQ